MGLFREAAERWRRVRPKNDDNDTDDDVNDHDLRKRIQKYYEFDADDQLVIESLLGEGTIVTSLEKYKYSTDPIC